MVTNGILLEQLLELRQAELRAEADRERRWRRAAEKPGRKIQPGAQALAAPGWRGLL